MHRYRDPDDGPEMYMVPMRKWIGRTVLPLAGAALLAILLFASIAYVPAGHVGVLTLFGRVTGDVLPEGTHLVNPFKVNNRMNIRTQELKETASVPSNEGLIVRLDTSLLLRLNPENASTVFQKIGPRYMDIVVEPNLRSAVRTVTAAHSANALYTEAREQVAQQIQKELERVLGPLGVEVQALLLRDIQLPETLRVSIEAKQQAEQESLRMTFILTREKQEADRKRIEAEGIRDFQQIVARGISQEVLTWKGIEATERLATSNNAKVIMIGSPRTGLPLILEPTGR
jgi:prohibitin 1